VKNTLDVSGAVTMQSTLKLSSGLSIASNGLKVTGGLSIRDFGATVPTLNLANNLGVKVVGGVTIQSLLKSAAALTVSSGSLYVNGGLTVSGNFNFTEPFAATNYTQSAGGVTVFAGGVSVKGGGLIVTGGLTNFGVLNIPDNLEVSGQMTSTGKLTTTRLDPVTNGITIDTNGLKIANDGGVPSNLNITTTGLTIEGGLTVGNSIYTTQFVKAAGKVNVMAGGLLLKGSGVGIRSGKFVISDTSAVDVTSVSVEDSGLIASGGLTLYNTDLALPNNLVIDNDIDVTSTFHADSGLTVSAQLAPINALTVLNGGVRTSSVVTNQLQSQGISVVRDFYSSGGVMVENGLTVGSGIVAAESLDVTGNMLIYDDILRLDDGLHIDTGNDMRVKLGHLVFQNGANSDSPEVQVKSGLTATEMSVFSGGLFTKGVNVDIKMGSTRGGATIKNNMYVKGAMSQNKEMIAGSGCSVSSGGLKVALHHGDQGSSTNYENVLQSPELFVHGDMYFDDTSLEGTHAQPVTRRTSDAQFKTNVVEVSGALALLSNVRGVAFTYSGEDPFTQPLNSTTKSESSVAKRLHLGVIAQEVQKAIPEAVSESQTQQHYLGVDYFKLVPVLIEGLRELVGRLKIIEDLHPDNYASHSFSTGLNEKKDKNTTQIVGQLLKVFQVLWEEDKDLEREHNLLTARLDHLQREALR